jgi:aminoglycoside/choline kinase family phosphotransferase
LKRPRKAIVLAAGFGSRLAPLTLDCPKPLIPLHGKPMILQVLAQLQSWGVKEVLVNVHHLAAKMVAELPALCPPDLKLNFSFEAQILGTGGGLRKMGWFFSEEPLWICNADVHQRLNPAPMLKAWEKQKPLACLWMIPEQGPRTVKVEKGRVRDFRAGGMTFSGLHLVNRELLRYLPDREFSSVIEAYDAALADKKKILGVTVPGSEWADLGTPEQLIAAEGGPVLAPGVRLRKGQIASGVVVSADVGLTPEERKKLPQVDAVGLLPARGSDRSFRRLYFENHTEIFMRSGEARPENQRFVGHSRFLKKQGIRVPEILESGQQGRWLRVEDLGGLHLLDRLERGSPARNLTDMKAVLKTVARLHAIKISGSLKLEMPFDEKLYAWERQLFENEFLKRHAPFSDARKWKQGLFRISEGLCQLPSVLLHRDLQSTNVMWVAGEPALIDFQGMRRGAAAYDLGSLLADPYVNRPRDLQLRLLREYNRVAACPVNETDYALGASQRLIQALGAYGRLGALKGNERFLAHIPAAVQQLRLWAGEFFEGQGGGNPLWDLPDE